MGRGTETERLKALVDSRKLDNVLFYDEIDPKEILSLLSICHVGLISLDPLHKSHNVPGKFLSYMQAGLPVLAKINKGTDLASLIEKEGVGYVYTGGEIYEFQHLAEELIDNKKKLREMSERGQALSCSMFSSYHAARQIVTSLSSYL